LHMQKGFEFDHDTFVIRSDSTGNYRLKITPEDISLFNSNILAEVYAPYGDIDSYIMNAIGGSTWREEAFFSDVFALEAGEESFLALSMRSRLEIGHEARLALPYSIELMQVPDYQHLLENLQITSETPDIDTSGYDHFRHNDVIDVMSLPDAKAGLIDGVTPTKAYLHIEPGKQEGIDSDLFLISAEKSGE